MKKAKAICSVLAVCILGSMLSSCAMLNALLNYNGYKGERTDLYTVAVNSIFGVRGYMDYGETQNDPKIEVIETDDYGRTLFFYTEDCVTLGEPGYETAFVIMQSSKDGYAYYYQDKCYIPYVGAKNDWESIRKELPVGYFDDLKAENHWNLELQKEKCAEIKITNKKSEGKLRPSRYKFDDIIYPYEVKNGYTGNDDSFFQFSLYCEADGYGRELYYVYGMTGNKDANGEDVFTRYTYAVIFQEDGSCAKNGIVRIPTPEDSRQLITELKQANNWNQLG